MKKVTILFHTQTKQQLYIFKKRFAHGKIYQNLKKLAQVGGWGGDYLMLKSAFLFQKRHAKFYY